MKILAFIIASTIVSGTAGVAIADHVDDVDFTDRNGETEFYVCHVDGHRNDRFIYNRRDRDFCNNVIGGHVEFMLGPEAADHVTNSQVICYQRNQLCLAPDET